MFFIVSVVLKKKNDDEKWGPEKSSNHFSYFFSF